MDKIIITGLNGYISDNCKAHFLSRGNYDILTLDLQDPNWREVSFEGVRCIIHTAALVHKDPKKFSEAEYETVNCELTKELAAKAKSEKVSHFIFFSTIAVYGMKQTMFKNADITKDTLCNPVSKYGKSKYHAELALNELCDDAFNVSIIRAPFVYGKGCAGNYVQLKKLVLSLPCCPKIENIKSMIYIKNLCEFVYQLYTLRQFGVFLPQDAEYVATYEMARQIAKYNNKKLWITRLINPFVYLASLLLSSIGKAFGSEYIDKNLSNIGVSYTICDFETAMRETESK